MKVHELIANLHDVNPDGEAEVKLQLRRRWGTRIAEIEDVALVSGGIVAVVEELDPEL